MTLTDRRGPDAPAPSTPDRPRRPHWSGAPADSRWLLEARSMVPELAQDAARLDRDNEFAEADVELFRRHRLMSMLVPTELGGGGASHAEACAVLAELAHGDGAASLALSMHLHLVAAQVWRHHRSLPAPALAKVAADELVLVSTGASDWIDSNGTARRVEGGYRFTARKAPASGAPAGAVLVTSARWEDAPDGPQVVHASVPFSSPGVHVEPTWDATGMRASGSHTVVLDDVFVPDEAVPLVRAAGVWHPVWATVVGAAMPLIMSTYVGIAERAVDLALELAWHRAERTDVAAATGRMVRHLESARAAVRSMIEASEDLHFDNHLDLAARVLALKAVATDAVIDTVGAAFEVGGGAAYASSSDLGRLLRDVHAVHYHPMPTAQQERFCGRVALGLDPIA